ncbi:phosphatase PAP2 family protein [Plantactinospora soyae]|uniref:Membrane-associated phospholipid phosphatase n=1 Tax=Plantactinospora soyae TaxID=1544732 RepID=A0A927M2U5_9ACTN|nr:phosphatase PAP2 family protein [Plantactinospora soyae]MBE1486619.1 membrane-associated phospholipid phosphatase [Plantactinospora soyae]
MRQTTTVRRFPRLRPVHPTGWWLDGVLVAAVVGLTVALAAGQLLGFDLAVRDWVDAHRPDPAYWVARVFNSLGQGGWFLMPIAFGLGALVSLRTRSVRPLLVPVGGFVLTSFTIGPMKLLLDRGYPHNWELPHPEELFSDPVNGTAYPSGHVANAIVWYGVIALLLAALLRTLGRPDAPVGVYRAIRVVPPAIVFCTTTYLGWHWITDSVAGLLLGLFLDRLLARVPWDDVPLPALPGGVQRHGVFTSDA